MSKIATIEYAAQVKAELSTPTTAQGFLSIQQFDSLLMSLTPAFNYGNQLWNLENDARVTLLLELKNSLSDLTFIDVTALDTNILRMSDNFRANGLTLPKQSSEIVINPKLIAKIPFYTFLITWIITLAYLIKL